MIFCKLLIFISLLVNTGNSNGDNNDDCPEDVQRIKRSAVTMRDKTFKKEQVYHNGVTTIITESWPR